MGQDEDLFGKPQDIRSDQPVGIWAASIVLFCLLPLFLLGLGVDLSTVGTPLDPNSALGLSPVELEERAFAALRGGLTHTLLEWTALCVAAFVGVGAFLQYRLTGDKSLPVIGMALVCAGTMDGFHVLVADRLIEARADNRELIPLTWAISRFFTGFVLLAGVGLFALRTPSWGRRLKGGALAAISAVLMLLAYIVIHYCATSEQLPRTMFSDGMFKRPYDIVPLVPLVICGVFVFPRYLEKRRTVFAHSLTLSIIPLIAAQLYMAFLSESLNDSAFNVAHALKAFAYLVPAFGLAQTYMITWRTNELQTAELSVKAEEVGAARRLAEAASRAKSDFLANMSHEIRTPMTAILGYADLLTEHVRRPENIRWAMEIKGNGHHLLGLLNDILDHSKIEAGMIELERVPCSPFRVVSDVCSLLRSRAADKGLRLDVDFQTRLPKAIHSDPLRLRQILINLVGNAIKFTDEGFVRLSVRRVRVYDPSSPLRFDVVDTGVGMNEESVTELFRPFTQAEASTTRRFGGTGLGLTISRQLARALGGELELVETAPDRGATFRLVVPTHVSADVELVSIEDLERGGGTRFSAEEPLDARILLAEDNPSNRLLITRVLERFGAEVVSVGNGREARDRTLEAAARGEPYDVVLMDVQMPELGGLEATRELRERGYSFPIVALTAGAMARDRAACLDAGCDDHASKPIDREALYQLVRRYTDRGFSSVA